MPIRSCNPFRPSIVRVLSSALSVRLFIRSVKSSIREFMHPIDPSVNAPLPFVRPSRPVVCRMRLLGCLIHLPVRFDRLYLRPSTHLA